MNRCPQCKLTLLNDTETCPLCHCVCEEMNEEEQAAVHMRFGSGAPYPDAHGRQRFKRLWLRIILLAFFVAEAVLIIINHYTTPKIWWSAITAGAFVYGYLFLVYWVKHDSGFAAKVGLQMVFTMIMLFLIDYNTGNYGWALQWAIPGVILFGDGIVFFLMLLNRSRWVSYILLLLVLGFISVIIITIDILIRSEHILLPILGVAVSVLYALGTVLIGDKAVKRELRRRFHV
ncbi:MAG: hypothetical protein IK115_08325 [Lachnospiraceae bacterium]|nr:hypothetical protein [Lachnospiraceae bacterium]